MTPRSKMNSHKCQGALSFAAKGQLDCHSDHVIVKEIPTKIDNLKFRERDILELMQLVMEKETRMITALGLHGIGKSCVVRNTLHHIYERKYFIGGICLI